MMDSKQAVEFLEKVRNLTLTRPETKEAIDIVVRRYKAMEAALKEVKDCDICPMCKGTIKAALKESDK